MSPLFDSRQLRAFVSLSRTRSFTLAARELNISQSAVSHSIRALEEDVGCTLFDRHGKKVSTTPAGDLLLQAALKVVAEMEAARDGLQRLNKKGTTRMRVGMSAAICQHLLPVILPGFQKSYPHCELSILPGDTPLVLAALWAQEMDIGIALEPRDVTRLTVRHLAHDDLRFIVSPQHAWAEAGRVSREAIGDEKYILYSRRSYTFELVEAYFAAEGIMLNNTIELGETEAIKTLVKARLGVGILAPWAAAAELADGSLVALPVGRKKLRRHWTALHMGNRILAPHEEHFVNLCQTAASRLVGPDSLRLTAT